MKKKRLRDIKLEDYGISKYRYRELKNFCLQYEEKKAAITYELRAVSIGEGQKSNKCNRPTENKAIRNNRYAEECRIIEEAAEETDSLLSKFILKGVTQDLPYEYIEYDENLGKIPVGKTEYYAYRRKFYSILDKKKS